MLGRIAAAVVTAGILLLPGIPRAQGPEAGGAAAEPTPQDRSLEQRVEALEKEQRSQEEAAREQQRLEQRVEELEAEKVAHEDATRSIIASTLSTLGSKINEFVDFGGVIEVLPAWEEDFQGGEERSISLNTLELQFEMQVTDWARGSVVVEYDDGGSLVFTTTEDDEFAIDRLNIDTALITLGDTERFWPYLQFGRMVVPFGISTGNPVTDVLNIVDPLTVSIFETKRDAILVGFEFPTPPPTPEIVTVVPPPVKPLVVAPLVGRLARLLGYRPPPPPPPTPLYAPIPSPRPPFTLGAYFYRGDTYEDLEDEGNWDLGHHLGAFAGYRSKFGCRPSLGVENPPDDLGWWHVVCPVGLELGVEYNRSVFDSDFLALQYRRFLGPADPLDQVRATLRPIGFVPGMAGSVRASLGPVAVVGEWNGAIQSAKFDDDTIAVGIPGEADIRPSAWQVSLAYQFGWNPSVEAIGQQGTYLTISYSATRDLGGVRRFNQNDFTFARVGSAPRRQLAVGVGEWVLPNLRLSLEYARAWDYSDARRLFPPVAQDPALGVSNGAREEVSNGIFSMVTFEW
jgi:outer membrane murein-binding lipoprotein Lpp